LVTESKRITAYPRLSSLHDWKDRFLYVSVPKSWRLPKHFRNDVHARLEPSKVWRALAVAPQSSVELTAEEGRALATFDCGDVSNKYPARWLPPAEVIFNDEYLCRMGLITTLRRGMSFSLPFFLKDKGFSGV